MIRKNAVVDVRLAALVLRPVDLEALLRLERLEHFAHRFRAVAGAGDVLQTQPIGLHFVVAAVALHPGLRADVGHLSDGRRSRGNRGARSQDRREHPPRLRSRRMSGGVVPDLVGEHGGQLRLIVQVDEQSPVHIHVAPARREGIHRVIIENEEFEVPARQRGVGGDLGPDLLHVVLDRLVLVQAVGLDDLDMDPARALLLAPGRAEDDVVTAGCGVRRAAADHESAGQRGQQSFEGASNGRDGQRGFADDRHPQAPPGPTP